MSEESVVANVSRGALANVIAAATAHGEGAEILTGGVGAYQDALVDLTDKDAITNPEHTVTRVIGLQGMIDGAAHGGEMGTARRQDEATRQAIDNSIGVLGALPLPSASGQVAKGALQTYLLNTAESYVVGQAKSQTLGGLSDYLWSGNLADVQSDVVNDENRQRNATAAAAHMIAEDLGVYDQFDHLPEGQYDGEVNTLLNHYKGFYDAMHDATADKVD